MVCASILLNLGDYIGAYSDWNSSILTDEKYKQKETYQTRKDDYFQRKRIDEYFESDCFDGEDDDEDCWN